MKALVYTGTEKVEIKNDIVVPELEDGQVKIKVNCCGVCGSDIGIYKGLHPRAKAPLIFGHEFIGEIVEIKGENRRLKVGDRVAPYPLISCGECDACLNGVPHVCKTLKIVGIDCDGGMAEYVNCDEDVLFKIDDSVSDKAAGTIEPLAVAIHSIHRSGFKPLDSAVILGAGPIGILIAIVLRNSGASKIIISELDDQRIKFCREMGFDVVDVKSDDLEKYVDEITDGAGVDIVYECTGAAPVAAGMTKTCRIDGMVCLVGVHKKPTAIELSDMHFRELNMTATRVYTKQEFKQAVEYTKEIAQELENVVTQVVPLSESENIFDLISDPELMTCKILVDCRK